MCSFLHKAREEEVLLRAEKPTAQGETGFRVWDAGLCRASFFFFQIFRWHLPMDPHLGLRMKCKRKGYLTVNVIRFGGNIPMLPQVNY